MRSCSQVDDTSACWLILLSSLSRSPASHFQTWFIHLLLQREVPESHSPLTTPGWAGCLSCSEIASFKIVSLYYKSLQDPIHLGGQREV